MVQESSGTVKNDNFRSETNRHRQGELLRRVKEQTGRKDQPLECMKLPFAERPPTI